MTSAGRLSVRGWRGRIVFLFFGSLRRFFFFCRRQFLWCTHVRCAIRYGFLGFARHRTSFLFVSRRLLRFFQRWLDSRDIFRQWDPFGGIELARVWYLCVSSLLDSSFCVFLQAIDICATTSLTTWRSWWSSLTGAQWASPFLDLEIVNPRYCYTSFPIINDYRPITS